MGLCVAKKLGVKVLGEAGLLSRGKCSDGTAESLLKQPLIETSR